MNRQEQLQALQWRMIAHDHGNPKRIQHFMKVAAFAVTIGRGEGADPHMLYVLESLGLIHDIGSRIAEEKHGYYTSAMQEEYGALAAREMLAELGYAAEDIDRICDIVSQHHHIQSDIAGLDFRALLEADACVNLYEKSAPKETQMAALQAVFRTDTGIRLFRTMFDLY